MSSILIADSFGIALAFASSVCNASASAVAKALTQHLPSNEGALAWQSLLTSMTFASSFLSQDDAWDQLVAALHEPEFITAWVISGGINIMASQLMQWGFRRGELGDTLPFLSFTPVFLVFAEYLSFQDTTTSANGAVGAMLISIGGFLLGRSSATSPANKDAKVGKPWQSIVLPPGAGIFIVVAIIWSISSYFDKRGVQAVPPLVYGAAIQATISVGAAAVWLLQGRGKSTSVSSKGVSIGLTQGVLILMWWALAMAAYWCQLEANRHIAASYLSAIRRAGCLFGLLLGRIFFKERIGRKLLPVSVMVLGVCLISVKL